ncbi:MAG: antibiotic biosynthesis monooxygenase [Frankiales bacterium]|nr:antibiotic biosynthesis monooxygenase [Frankiales bacterium]
MLLVVATLPAKPDTREELAALLVDLAKTSRGDAGCLSYAFYADLEDPDVFISVETWDEQASLDAHMQQPHVTSGLGKLPGLLGGAPSIMVHDVASTTKAM